MTAEPLKELPTTDTEAEPPRFLRREWIYTAHDLAEHLEAATVLDFGFIVHNEYVPDSDSEVAEGEVGPTLRMQYVVDLYDGVPQGAGEDE